MELIQVYEGPTVLAEMLREALAERGVRSIIQAVGPFLGIIGDAARTPFSIVLVTEADWETRRVPIEESLAFVTPSDSDPESAS